MTARELIDRCDYLTSKANYGPTAALVIDEHEAARHGLSDLATNPRAIDPGFRMTAVDVPAAAARKRLSQA